MTVRVDPRVMRTPMVSLGALIAEGHMFADGKRRIFVPEETPDGLIDELTAALVEADEKAERLARGIAAVEALLSGSDDSSSGGVS